MQQRGVQDVHGDAEGPRQPELLSQPRQAPDTQEAPLANLLTFKATHEFNSHIKLGYLTSTYMKFRSRNPSSQNPRSRNPSSVASSSVPPALMGAKRFSYLHGIEGITGGGGIGSWSSAGARKVRRPAINQMMDIFEARSNATSLTLR